VAAAAAIAGGEMRHGENGMKTVMKMTMRSRNGEEEKSAKQRRVNNDESIANGGIGAAWRAAGMAAAAAHQASAVRQMNESVMKRENNGVAAKWRASENEENGGGRMTAGRSMAKVGSIGGISRNGSGRMMK